MSRGSVILLLIFCLSSSNAPATQFFVSTSGNDSNPGTFDQPFLTLAKPLSLSSAVFKPGDTIAVRGGVYPASVTLNISKNGLSQTRYYLLAYPGERPILDFSAMAISDGNRGINLRGNFWVVKGFDVKGAGDNGMNISGSNNIVEYCTFYEHHDTGLQLSGGASGNQVINCDSYWNVDPGQGNADGFAPKLDVGSGNSFSGCRAWQNSDDGWDGYMRGANDVTTTLDNCWCFANGYLKDGTASTGNGNGYKMGGSDTKDLSHNVILKRCLAFENRVKGFDQNNNRGSMTLYNCTGYRNGTNYAIADTVAYSQGKVVTVKNCIALGNPGSLRSNVVQQTNSWNGFSVTPADFISIDTTGMRAPRKADGSLPDVFFMHLSPSSPLVDAGTNVGLPYSGKAPDLGAFETDGGVNGVTHAGAGPVDFRILPTFPNPFNPSTTLTYSIPVTGSVSVRIYDLSGRLVNEFVEHHGHAGTYSVRWDGTDTQGVPLASGTYLARISSDGLAGTARLVLIR